MFVTMVLFGGGTRENRKNEQNLCYFSVCALSVVFYLLFVMLSIIIIIILLRLIFLYNSITLEYYCNEVTVGYTTILSPRKLIFYIPRSNLLF